MNAKPNALSCLRCGNDTTTGKLKAGNADTTVVIAGTPDDFLGIIPYTTSPVNVRVCKACGHIELVAKNLQDILTGGGDD